MAAVPAVFLPPTVSMMVEQSSEPEDFADFNQSAVLTAPDGLSVEALAEVLGVVVDHHPMLTARLELTPSARYELTAGTGFDAVAAVSALTSRIRRGHRGFSMRTWSVLTPRPRDSIRPPVGWSARRSSRTGGRVVVVIHHLGVDAVSWQAIIEDLIVAWAQRSAGASLPSAGRRHLRAGLDERAQCPHDDPHRWRRGGVLARPAARTHPVPRDRSRSGPGEHRDFLCAPYY